MEKTVAFATRIEWSGGGRINMLKSDINTLAEVPVFLGVPREQIEQLTNDLKAIEKSYRKGEFLLMAGNSIANTGIVLSGTAQITRENADGERSILSELLQGDLFGEAYAAAEVEEIPVTVIASSFCRVLWIPFKMFTENRGDNAYFNVLTRNMMKLIAMKNVWMNEKMRILSCKTTREKMTAYLMNVAERTGRRKFKIPFSREELADYLSVDRSALSRELGKMRDEGYITFNKNEFELMQKKGD